jgi:hypothetical protein
MQLVVLVCLALLVAALWLLGRALRRSDGALSGCFALLPLGVYGLIVLPWWIRFGNQMSPQEGRLPLYGSLWSYVNGMESAALLMLYALIAWMWTSRREGILFGVALAGFALARLDHVFLPLFCLAWIGGRAVVERDRASLIRFAKVAAPFALFFGAYLLSNLIFFGSLTPVSGRLKSSFPRVDFGNLRRLWFVLKAPLESQLGRTYRLWQLVFPAIFGLAYILSTLRLRPRPGLARGCGRLEEILLLTAPTVMLVSLYDFFFVELWSQGHWYTPLGTLFCSLATINWWQRYVRAPLWLENAILASAMIGSLVIFHAYQVPESYHSRYAAFYFEEAPLVRRHYGSERPCMLEIDDGIVAFSTGYPTMSATGLTLDREAYAWLKRDQLVTLAVRRGCDRIASLVYFDLSGVRMDSSSEKLAPKGILHSDTDRRLLFSADYLHSGFLILRAQEP